MNHSFESMPNVGEEGDSVDFDKKRLRFWLETVPPDLRRLEYELYKRNRKLINANLYKYENKRRYGRFTMMPAFTEELEYNAWENFQNSFLKGEERKKRFSEILESAKNDVPVLLKEHGKIIPREEIN